MIRKILDIFIPKTVTGTNKVDEGLSNKVLLAELVEHFKDQIDRLSVGERMIYPMSFNVLLHHEDYAVVKESFPFVLPEVVKEFYKVIKSMKKSYPDFTPVAKDWVFQFSSCQLNDINLASGNNVIVNKGHITTLASLMAVDLKQKNTSVSANTRVSIKLQDSNVMGDMNINWDAISKIDILGENYFRCKFDPALNAKSVTMEPGGETSHVPEAAVMAVLSYSKDGKNYSFSMIDNLIDISGPQGPADMSSVFRIEQSSLLAPHVQVKYVPDSKKFQFAVYGTARVNGREYDLSQPGLVKWFTLANNSKLFINNEVSVKFEIK
jgi:hypothetical protein